MNSVPNNFSAADDSPSIDELINLLLEEAASSDDQDIDAIKDRLGEELLVSEKNLEALIQPSAEDSPQQLEAGGSQLDDSEIDVEIESAKNPTLEEAVEYRAFLQQTIATTAPENVDSTTITDATTSLNTKSALSELEQDDLVEPLGDLDSKQADTEDLAEAVNSIIPLIRELLQFKLDQSREGVIQTIRPVIDQLIEARIQEDSPKMAAAIAQILPDAISERINLNPETIAKAIAPEIALSIKEQIRLDESAIPQALGPEMGKAIKAQIESEKDAMVDALYPVIGSTISKYMVEVVRDINNKVENTLSPQGIKRKFQAKIQGVSEAELIFRESVGYRLRAIFLIAKDSGLVIQELQLEGEEHLDSDMLAGMLTAIRSFANDCISSGSELDLIDYGDWKIPLEVAGYCYLAAVVYGEPNKQFITKFRQVLGEIVLEHDAAIQNFSGDSSQVPPGIKQKLEQLTTVNPKQSPKSGSANALLWLIAVILGLIFIPWGIVSYRARVAHNIEQKAIVQLDSDPELSVYRFAPQVKNGQLTVSGRVPSPYLRRRAENIAQALAQEHQLKLDNQILAVKVPVNPTLVTGEITRLTRLFNQQPSVAIKTEYQPSSLSIKGLILDATIYQTIREAFRQIPGVEQITFEVAEQLPTVKQRIYFVSGSSELDFADNFSKIEATQQLLRQYSLINLKLTVHSDGIGSATINQQLSRSRCQNVKTALVTGGIEPNRIVMDCDALSLPENNLEPDPAALLKRYVAFELFIPPNLSQ
ncbi:MAG: OmpA family protein [Cyanobacteria bacterium J06621_8]